MKRTSNWAGISVTNFGTPAGSVSFKAARSQGEIAPELLSSDDKWILLKLDKATREITTAFSEYRFNEATQTLYRFFWSEYCDWYIEASKAVLAAPSRGRSRARRRGGAARKHRRSG